jgi:hypothetical protein
MKNKTRNFPNRGQNELNAAANHRRQQANKVERNRSRNRRARISRQLNRG